MSTLHNFIMFAKSDRKLNHWNSDYMCGSSNFQCWGKKFWKVVKIKQIYDIHVYYSEISVTSIFALYHYSWNSKGGGGLQPHNHLLDPPTDYGLSFEPQIIPEIWIGRILSKVNIVYRVYVNVWIHCMAALQNGGGVGGTTNYDVLYHG